MRKHLIGAVALFAITSMPAMAADLPVKAPPPVVAVASWTGFYIGINGGGGWGHVDNSVRDIGPDSFFAIGNILAVTQAGGQNFDTSGALAGGQVGYLYQSGRAIFGVELSVDWTNFTGTLSNGPTAYPVTPGSNFAWNLRGSSDVLALLTGRFGIDLGNWYPYVTGGGAYQRIKYSANFVDSFYPSNVINSFSSDAFGLAVGAGAEYRITQNWMLRGEYLHIEFNHFGGNGLIACSAGVGACANPANNTTFQYNVRFREDIGRVFLSYRF